MAQSHSRSCSTQADVLEREPTAPRRIVAVANARISASPEWSALIDALRGRGAEVSVATPYAALQLARASTLGDANEHGAELVISWGLAGQVAGELAAARTGAVHVVVDAPPRRKPSRAERALTRMVAPRVDGIVAANRTHLPRLMEAGYLPSRVVTVVVAGASSDRDAGAGAGGDPRVAPSPGADGPGQPALEEPVEQYATHILSFAREPTGAVPPLGERSDERKDGPGGLLPARIVRHWNSAFSRGVGYEFTPAGPTYDADSLRGYYIDFRAKTVSPSARAPHELLPAGLAQLALGWWERSLLGEPDALAQFDRACRLLNERAEQRGGELLWPYDFTVRKYPEAWPPYSALAQAQAASVFARAYVRSGDERDAELARQSIHPLLHDTSPLVAVTADGPILEESPGEPASHILNGWIYALWGLRDVVLGLGDADAEAMYDRSLACLRHTIDRYDVGWWTRYSLYPHKLPDLAKPFYHSLHIDQAAILDQLTGYPEFAAAARRWRSYATPLHQARAIAQKAAFVATGYV